jgi:hypothetical protein
VSALCRRSLPALTPCLQRACGLRHTVADLAVRATQDRRTRQFVGAYCGQHSGVLVDQVVTVNRGVRAVCPLETGRTGTLTQ